MKTKLLITLFAFSIVANAQFTKLYDFNLPTGARPYGGLLCFHEFLYGMTWYGGSYNAGVIFKIKPDGTNYTNIFEFRNDSNGMSPLGTTLITDGTFLYGMTSAGGLFNQGVIFKIKPDGTTYTKLLDFNGGASAHAPNGSLIFDGTYLYGMTPGGGTFQHGILFKIKPQGTDYTVLVNFKDTATGSQPRGSLINDGEFLYGMTAYGGINDKGVVFKVKTSGTDFTKLLDFNDTINGSYPEGDLTLIGIYIYGVTARGGVNDRGVLFKIKTDGTGYNKLLDFTGLTNGANPSGALVYEANIIYGVTANGGIHNAGVLFRLHTDGTGYAKLFDFDGSQSINPLRGPVILENALYGNTLRGGIYGQGILYKYQLPTSSEADKKNPPNFILFPNPSNGTFQLKTVAVNTKQYQVEIYNVVGEKVYFYTFESNSATLNLNAPNGIYTVKVKTDKDETITKLIIQK